MSEFNKTFTSVDEKAEYFFNLATKLKSQCEAVANELSEFESSSRELESELETQVAQLEKKNKELVSTLSKLTLEQETLQEKYDKSQLSNFNQISELETKLSKSEEFVTNLQTYIRKLEQINDDLERSKRITVVSLDDFEARLNKAIERNAILENELDEKENLIFDIQRLKDETRDLQQELTVRDRRSLSNHQPMDTAATPTVATPTVAAAIVAATTTSNISSKPDHGLKRSSISSGAGDTMAQHFTHQSKKQVLELTADMLRGINSLESKFTMLTPQFTARMNLDVKPIITTASSTS